MTASALGCSPRIGSGYRSFTVRPRQVTDPRAEWYAADGSAETSSCVYWGSVDGFDPADRAELPTITAAGVAIGWIE